ncbi:MAG: hypothetical protein OHK0023_11970 [Anaerolineae bacterium]
MGNRNASPPPVDDYLVPSNSLPTVKRRIGNCQNLSLILARYIPESVIMDRGSGKGDWLKRQARALGGDVLNKLAAAYYQRWLATTQGSQRFTGTLQSRMIVGLGGKNPLEIGITLAYITGLPIIPGSALKGLARAYGLLHLADHMTQTVKVASIADNAELLETLDTFLVAEDRFHKDLLEDKAINALALHFKLKTETVAEGLDELKEANHYRRAFGSQKYAGVCAFHDAVPVGLQQRPFEVDVMTPHFVKYYNSANSNDRPDTAPHDGDNPKPVNFLTVARRTTFAFAVGLRRVVAADENAIAAQAVAVEWLKKGLDELGVGAKTASGYGVFEKFKDMQ